jgi:hypothetical protein
MATTETDRAITPSISMVELIDTTRLARLLSVTPKCLEAQRVRGEGVPFIRIGRLVRYHPQTVADYLAQQTRRSTSERTGLTGTV